MAESRSKAEWGRTASLMALLANVNRDPKKHRPFRPSDFDPHEAKEPEVRLKGNIDLLIRTFVNVDQGEEP
jgi:hypothetical protein